MTAPWRAIRAAADHVRGEAARHPGFVFGMLFAMSCALGSWAGGLS